MSMIQKSKPELVQAYNRARSAIANAKEKSRGAAQRGTSAVLTVGGGYIVGMARKKMGEGSDNKILIPGTEIEGDLLAGGALVGAGLLGLGDEYAPQLTALGSGMLAGYAAIAALK